MLKGTLGKRTLLTTIAVLLVFSLAIALNFIPLATIAAETSATDGGEITGTDVSEADIDEDIAETDDFDYEGNGFIEAVGGMFGKLAEPFDLSLKGINLYAATSATGIEIEEPVWGDTITLFAATQKDLQDAVNGTGDYFGFTSNSKTIIIPGDITFTSSSTIIIPAGMEIKLMSDDSLRTIDAGKLCRGVTVNDGGKLWLENIKITNSNSSGGMYYTGGGTLCMTNSYISGNSGDGLSNNVYAAGDFSLIMNNSEISNNSGYGIYAYANTCFGVTISITDSKICNNGAQGLYASTYNLTAPITTINVDLLRSSISDNVGGIYINQCFSGILNMTDSFLLNNKWTALQSYVTDTNPAKRFRINMDNTHIGNEGSSLTTCGMHLTCTDVEMRNGSSIRGIRNGGTGGGACMFSSTLTMYDSEVSDNQITSGGGAGVWMNNYGGAGASRITMYHSEMSDNECLPNSSGNRASGGAIYLGGSSIPEVQMYNSKMLRNTAVQGGAISMDAYDAKLIIENSELSYNTADRGYGAAIYNNGSGELRATGATFVFNKTINSSSGGGTVRSTGSNKVSFEDCKFTDNSLTTDGYGGAALCLGSGTSASPLLVKNCIFERNTVDAISYGGGGAIFCNYDSYLNIENCTIQDNNTVTGSYGGGGLFANGTVKMTGGKITGSKSIPVESGFYRGGSGGGVTVNGGTFTIENVEISGNEAQGNGAPNQGDGGGIFMQSGTLIIKEGCSIKDNIAERNGGGIGVSYPTYYYYSSIVIEEDAGLVFSGNKASRVFIPQDETGLNTDILTPGKITSVSVDPNLLKLLGKPNNGLYPYTNYDINVTGDSALQYIDDGDVHGTGTYPIALSIADEEQHGVLGYNGSAPDEYFLSCWEVVNGSGTVIPGGGASSSRSGSIMAALGTLIPSPAGGGEAIAAPVMITSGPIGIGDFVAIGAKIIPDPASTPGDILILNAVWEELPKFNLTYNLNTKGDQTAQFNSAASPAPVSSVADVSKTYEVGGGAAISAHDSFKANNGLDTAPTSDGYTFTGWYEDKDCKTLITTQTMPEAAKTIYAGWKEPGDNETITIEIKKTWVHGSNPQSKWPESVTVYVNNRKINDPLTEKNQWGIIVEDLNKYDKNGREINYTVDEANVPGYTKSISRDGNLFTITNTYGPGGGNGPGSGSNVGGAKPPNTSDDNLFWLMVMCGMALIGGLTLLMKKRFIRPLA